MPWVAYLARDAAVTVQVTARKSALYHSGAIADRVASVLERPLTPPDGDGVRLWVRMVKDRATLSVDAGGGLMHRRGWRRSVGPAPLRETLAAACVRLADLAPEQPLWDPFCGSGTIPIEAALIASEALAQPGRRHAFQGWPTHEEAAYSAWQSGSPAARATGRRVLGTDLEADAIAGATANAERAGATACSTWLVGDFEAHIDAIPQGAAVVTNTPYGKRLAGGGALQRLFTRFGHVLSSRSDLGPVLALVGARGFEAATGLPWETVAEFSNRGTPTRLLRLVR
jgi:putative N6-adenine-specific DNA methylase